jgi:predicted nucleic acid-binding protein
MLAIVKTLLGLPGVVLLAHGDRHLEMLETLAADFKVTGPLVTDAVLGAMAIENGATMASTDRDFSRFENLRWVNPLEESAS